MDGLIGWFARNHVAANLLMVFIVAWGLVTLFTRLPLEVFPAFELDQVIVSVPLPGATPGEVEEGVVVRVEEALEGLAGIRRLTSVASEGAATVSVEVENGTDPRVLATDIEQRVERISGFPAEAEAASVTVPLIEQQVISVLVSGALPERELHAVAARARDELEALPNVSSVTLSGTRRFELAIEVSPAALERYGLTLAEVSRAIEDGSLDLAAGAIDTSGGEILLRARGQARSAADYASLVVLSRADGTRVTLGEVATIRDGFAETPLEQRFDGLRSIEIEIYRRGAMSALTVAEEVKGWIEDAGPTMPHGVVLGYWRDASRAIEARVATLLSSALQGGALILILLTLFLRFRVAFWVFVGVPVSVLGGIATMGVFGVSLNLLSLFAFILVLGIVVDDAIVTGENIYTHMRRRGDRTEAGRVEAVIEGTREVALPVTFGVLTTVTAFSPLLMIDGVRGEIFAQIPLVVIPVLLFSIVESKFVLPAHMRHASFAGTRRPNVFARFQQRFADGFERAILRHYRPLLAAALRQRYLTLAVFIGAAMIVFSLVISGQLRFVFFPRVQSELAQARLTMPEGTPFAVTRGHIERIEAAARTLQARHVDPETNESVIESVLSSAGSTGGSDSASSHVGRVMFEIVPPEERTLDISSSELVDEWRAEIGTITGAESLIYRAEIGGGGSPIDVELAGRDFDELREAAAQIRERLGEYDGVSDVTDTFEGGKREIGLVILPGAEQLGLTLSSIARQVRAAFLGSEVQTLQRDREEVRVVVRYPAAERTSLESLERLMIRTDSGAAVPLASVARFESGRGFSSIRRVDRRRTVNVRADVDKERADIEAIKEDLEALGESIGARLPDVSVTLEGEAREQRESFASLRTGLLFVLLVVYTLLAIPFKSYLQPLLVMAVIPFGVVGGVLGHMLMGMPLSIMSYMGMLALCGVVVNDSLVLVDWVNRRRLAGDTLTEAVGTAGVARFRAVVLTSLTTFFGLVPLIMEDSTQAQFLIPMAVSLGFGILFATLVTLLLVPVNYLVLEDLKVLPRRIGARFGEARTVPRP